MRLALRQQSDGSFRSRWRKDKGAQFSGGSAKRSSRKGASVSFRFTGSKIRWVGAMSSRGGKAKVYLDGRYVATVDTYAPQREVCQVLFADSVKAGKHTLKIVVAGRHRSRSAGNRVDVDAFIVLG